MEDVLKQYIIDYDKFSKELAENGDDRTYEMILLNRVLNSLINVIKANFIDYVKPLGPGHAL